MSKTDPDLLTFFQALYFSGTCTSDLDCDRLPNTRCRRREKEGLNLIEGFKSKDIKEAKFFFGVSNTTSQSSLASFIAGGKIPQIHPIML